jgi:hypothetical protein
MRGFQKGKALLAFGLGLLGASSAYAQSYDITKAVVGAPGNILSIVSSPGLGGGTGSQNVRIGRATLTGTDALGAAVQFNTYCIDIINPLGAGTFTASDIASSGFDVTRLTNVATFLEHTDAFAVDANSAAAVQLGIWEIMNESAGTAWNTSSGTFSVQDRRGLAAETLANGWLASLASNEWRADPSLRLQVLVPDGINQAQVRLVAARASSVAAVPEPASWALMVGGFGLIGGTMRRRRTQIAFS